MKFFCLCMSPAIDATVTLPRAPQGAGEIFKDVAEEENVGGKAVNVARWLAIRGAEVACGGLLGEDNDRPFVKELAKYAIEDRFVRVPGATRRNEMIVWPGGSVKLNRAAFPGLAAVPSLDALLPLASVTPPAVAILSGSLPPVVPKDFYASAVARLKSLGFTVVLDASGAALVEGIKAHPDVIKPNAEECEPLVGFVPKAPGEFVAAPKVDVVDTTAAGDTLLAEASYSTIEVSAFLQFCSLHDYIIKQLEAESCSFMCLGSLVYHGLDERVIELFLIGYCIETVGIARICLGDNSYGILLRLLCIDRIAVDVIAGYLPTRIHGLLSITSHMVARTVLRNIPCHLP